MALSPEEISSLVLVGMLILICWVIFYQPKLVGLERFEQRSYRDWPDQPLSTAARLSKMTRGYNQNIDPTLPDPYLLGVLNMSGIENSWVSADWSATK